jgi:hypothetical protein
VCARIRIDCGWLQKMQAHLLRRLLNPFRKQPCERTEAETRKLPR